MLTLDSIISTFGQTVQQKLTNPAASGQPEDQLRAPFEQLLTQIATLLNITNLAAIGESAIQDLKTRPDYSITIRKTLVGFVELKAPGKGADPRKFKDRHDRAQWQKLQSLPNLIYSDGNSFSLWQDGELVGSIISFSQTIQAAGKKLTPPAGLLELFQTFLLWQPIAPRNAKELAHISARLCRLLRDEVTEQLTRGSEALTALATDWRKLLFPDATDVRFADGYAQAVTFGLLMARANGIELSQGFDRISGDLKGAHSLIGAALRLLTENPENQSTLKISLQALVHVLNAVDWPKISKGNPETWLYFYEDFLEVYDPNLRKETGSYYTPPVVVETMTRLVDEVLKSQDFSLQEGLASSQVTVVDPATGTGTYILGVLRQIAEFVRVDQGEGAVAAKIEEALKRLIAFELQLGPFAVAQLRILAEAIALTGSPPRTELRMFVTDTLADPEDDAGWIPQILAPIAKSRRDASKIKREEPVTVVIGNPPYRERAKGRGGWIEVGNSQTNTSAPLLDWMPPSDWGVSVHAKHLRNLYVYFWRWATWKVFDCHPNNRHGIVCFITVAGFLNGPGFQRMREYLRQSCDRIWVIDCSPEGHQPEVNTRIFKGVQQPVCIVLASRSKHKQKDTLATVKFRALSPGLQSVKFEALQQINLQDEGWIDCPMDGRSPFLPALRGAWSTYVALQDLFIYNGSGVMPGRTWIIAPDPDSLERRWNALINAPSDQKETLFHPHLRGGKPGDKHSAKIVKKPLAGQLDRLVSVAQDVRTVIEPVTYAYRSFDRQWIIPDSRLINQPNPKLWEIRSSSQIYLTALSRNAPSAGPAVTVTALIPDLHHYNARGGRVFPLWDDAAAMVSNIQSNMLTSLGNRYRFTVTPEDLMAYVVAIAAHPHFTRRFRQELVTPGIRIPMTADGPRFQEAVRLGQRVIWLHTFGERMTDPAQGRPQGPPRLPVQRRPTIPKGGAIPSEPERMPDTIEHDAQRDRLWVGEGYIDNVPAAIWDYEVSGKKTVLHWFSYRKKTRERPVIGDRRPLSPLNEIYPDHWLPEYTTDLLNLLNVLGLLIDLEPQQAALLDQICEGEMIPAQALLEANVSRPPRGKGSSGGPSAHMSFQLPLISWDGF
ncbi:MAG: hypothetical protein Fur0042_18980 [Cyanophyceae cyanobacterium]